jgi:hypothetical protein
VRQGEPGEPADVVGADGVPTFPGGKGDRGLGEDDVRAHPVDVAGSADGGDLAQRRLRQPHRAEPGAGGRDPRRERLLGARPGRGEAGGVGLVGQPAAHHLGPDLDVAAGADLDGEPEAVQQLRAQLPLLRVHRPDQQEPGRVPDRHPVAFDVGDPERRRVEQQVDQMVVEQVHLIDVEQPAVRGGEQPRAHGRHPVRERAVEVEGTCHPVLRGADGQLHQPGRTGDPVARVGGMRVRPVGAVRLGGRRVAGKTASGDDVDRRQQGGQRPDRRRFGGPLLASDEHAAQARRNGGELQREKQVAGADHGGQRVGHGGSSLYRPAGQHRTRRAPSAASRRDRSRLSARPPSTAR